MIWPDTFRPFTVTHLLVVVVFVVFALVLVGAGRRWRRAGRGRHFDRVLGIVGLITWGLINAWVLHPARFDPGTSLPLHICDITALLAPLALLWPARILRAILYFWGIGFSAQGFIQPDLLDGPATAGFWLFWANHYLVVALAIYDLAARGYRPDWGDFAIAVAGGFVYVGVVLPINVSWEWNYGYLGPQQPGQPTLIDHLGPWPWRVLVLIGLTLVGLVVMVLPWSLRRGFKRRAPHPTPAVRGADR